MKHTDLVEMFTEIRHRLSERERGDDTKTPVPTPMVFNALRRAHSDYYLAETKKSVRFQSHKGAFFGGGISFDETRLDCFDHKTRLYKPQTRHRHCE